MNFRPNYALYYPTIEFRDYYWLWSASLLWDRIYRIVPRGYRPKDPTNVKKLIDSGEIGIPIYPDDYATKIADEFIDKLNNSNWDAAALTLDINEEYAKLHQDKVDVKLRQMIITQGTGRVEREWLYVPTEFESLYMTYLAKSISELNNLNLLTNSSAAWTGVTYFKYDGNVSDFPSDELTNQLTAIIIKDFLPENLLYIPAEDILAFREKRKSERNRFVNVIKKAATNISNCRDPLIIEDLIEDLKKEIDDAISQYKKSADLLKVTGWTGIKSLFFPVITEVISNYITLDSSQLKILSTAGVALGLITGLINITNDLKKLSQESDFSYLFELQNRWHNIYQGYDYNWYLYRQMEEFIND